jgi:hypothetical protein
MRLFLHVSFSGRLRTSAGCIKAMSEIIVVLVLVLLLLGTSTAVTKQFVRFSALEYRNVPRVFFSGVEFPQYG